MIGKSLKQLRRTPATTTLFVVLFAVSSFFICAGIMIWARNQDAIKTYEDTFLTIGTVRQRATAMEITERWDAFSKDYTRKSTASYASVISESVLDFEDAGYLLGPEKRPYYGALRPDLKLWPDDTRMRLWCAFIVEVTPLEDCVPDSPVEVRIESVLGEVPEYAFEPLSPGETIMLCDHYNDDPEPLYAGKTYLMCILPNGTHGTDMYADMEYMPLEVAFSTQYNADGSQIENIIVPSAITEVTPGFYETEEGRLWLNYVNAIYNSYKTVPVLPTTGTQLILPFYNNSAYLVAGEDISSKEYKDGEQVCLISQSFSTLNNISVGDTLLLPLYFADYANAPNDAFADVDHTIGGGLFEWDIGARLNANGEPYPVFSSHEYTVKGIYANFPGNDASYALGANTVIIPATSVTKSDKDNILAYGPMKDTTTAFQIPNGSIELFTERVLAKGIGDLEFTFHDRGYTQLYRGLENMKRISVLFLVIGAAMSLALIFFFCYIFISKNKLRTAIERMLGYTKKQCAVSLLSGFLFVAALAISVGCAAGIVAEKQITSGVTSQEYYDTSFTIGPLASDGITLDESAVSLQFVPVAWLTLLIITGLISTAFMYGNVKEEPLKLLGKKE